MSKQPPLLILKDAFLSFGEKEILEGAQLSLMPRERACLVGRNGSGKSTLMKILAGLTELDRGERFVKPGCRVALLGQSVLPSLQKTVFNYVADDLHDDVRDHEILEMLDILHMKPDQIIANLSGGEGRRVALARALVQRAEILLLDEPTNHLDIRTIEWLEGQLQTYPGALLMISHDRSFLTALSKKTFWMDRGSLRTLNKGYTHFDEWAEGIREVEEAERVRLNQKIAEETEWLHKGVTARRKRNIGRLERLLSLRKDRAEWKKKEGSLQFTEVEDIGGSKLAVEMKDVAKSYGDRVILKDASLRIKKGDRVGIIGPNGAGKSTLVKLITGELTPDGGRLRRAKNMTLVSFEQDQSSLKLTDTPWQALCPGGGDQVMVQGEPRHVVGYLQDFLFTPKQARTPIRDLSGGERNRLMLAKILAIPSNFLVLDEPTNDLDMDSLDLLQEFLNEYKGTLLIVSHDRDFLDRTVNMLIAVEGDGTIQDYVGGYEDYLRARPAPVLPADKAPPPKAKENKPKAPPKKLSYNLVRERESLPAEIESLHKKIHALEAELHDPSLFSTNPDRFQNVTKTLEETRTQLHHKEERWIEIELMAEEMES